MFFRKNKDVCHEEGGKRSGRSSERREWTPEEIKRKQDEFSSWYAKRLKFSRRVFKINEFIWAVLWSGTSIVCLYQKDPLPVFLSGPAAVGFWILILRPTRFAVWLKTKVKKLGELLEKLLSM